eukprot:TRINITY_DN2416_c1_g1_i1.p1 TRINITY_DN2416_c1_g1~~TRINITY_DN2416_c1_g1_i1.p1  ORF type:complete len:1272 (-),score=336.31 TRINITY_DN2416_c1_g1_i1:51-3866(-)
MPTLIKTVQRWWGDKYGIGYRDDTGYPVIELNNVNANAAQDFPSNSFHTTKYTLWSFLWKVLWEQFRKATSFYFLIIVIISCIPQISPITPYTSIAGLVFILVVAAVREAYEDYLRRKADHKVNNRKYLTIEQLSSSGDRVMSRSKWLRVGDLVYIRNDEQIPADLVLLATANDDGVAYIETSQLDGETNLKPRKAPETTSVLSLGELANLEGELECENPHTQLYSFKAKLVLTSQSRPISLDTNNILLMGSSLRNTAWAVGILVYVGPETKLSLNQKKPPSKFSRLDKRLNHFVYALFSFNVGLCTICAILAAVFNTEYSQKNDYIGGDKTGSILMGVKVWFSYFALLSYLIPLSLVVSLEMVKVIQARFMEWDEKMATADGKTMSVKTSNLNDELGLVQYVFSDKTGTLTENQMDFLKCSVRGRVYEAETLSQLSSSVASWPDDNNNNNNSRRGGKGKRDKSETDSEEEEEEEEEEEGGGKKKRRQDEHIRDFLLAMGLGHTAVTDIDLTTKQMIYKASSPDEEALCSAAAKFGVKFIGRNRGAMKLEINSSFVQEYETLCVMEFTSDRRRMSIILRYPSGRIRLICKGADSMIYERLAPGDETMKRISLSHLDDFSKDGLRTLVYAGKDLTTSEWESFEALYNEANSKIVGREEEVEKLCDEMERGLKIIGCSAIEDKLQQLVPETISFLLAANIKVWVITGDKQATAINIGYSTRLLTPEMKVVKINATTSDETQQLLEAAIKEAENLISNSNSSSNSNSGLKRGLSKGSILTQSKNKILSLAKTSNTTNDDYNLGYESSSPLLSSPHPSSPPSSNPIPSKIAMVIDGVTLRFALSTHERLFLQFSKLCHSVICNRVTPLQKAEVVRLIKTSTNAVTLSIGDGANDVSMIQEANIGVGIFGKEGNQAARSADFALRQFSHLKRLIIVHGRYSLLRNALLVHYSFYKNAAIFLCQFWFATLCGFSGQTLYDDIIMTCFNITITAAPPLIVGTFEKDVDDEVLEKNPELYERTQSGQVFTGWTLGKWLVSGLWHSIVLFWLGVWIEMSLEGFLVEKGKEGGFWMMGNVMMFTGMVMVFGKLGIEIELWNGMVVGSIVWSWAVYLVTVIVENSIKYVAPKQFFVFYMMWTGIMTYYYIILAVFIALLPDFIYKAVKRNFFPERWQILQEQCKSRQKRSDQRKKKRRSSGINSSNAYALTDLSSTSRKSTTHSSPLFLSDKLSNRLDQPLLTDDALEQHSDVSNNNNRRSNRVLSPKKEHYSTNGSGSDTV